MKITPDGSTTTPTIVNTFQDKIVSDKSGNLYTSSLGSPNVSKINPDGTFTTFGTAGSSIIDMVIDDSGNVFTLNQSGSSRNIIKTTPDGISGIFILLPDTYVVSTIAIDRSNALYLY